MAARPLARASLEVIGGVAVAIGVVAALDVVAPITGLSVVPLLVVLAVSIRRGQVAGLAAAVLSVLALNFFFLQPRYRLTIADSGNVVTLVVFLIAAVVVGRLAAMARARAHEAEARAAEAAAREREAALLAAVARRLLGAGSVPTHLGWIGERVGEALGLGPARVALSSAPAPDEGERAIRLPVEHGAAWLYVRGSAPPERVVEPLARLLDVALERDRLGARAAEAEAAQRADVAKTAVLHAISHDLRSPLTAITTAADALRDDATGAEDRAELLAVVREEAERLTRLVSDLLDLSRIEASAVHPQEDWVDLREVVARAVDGTRCADGTDRQVVLELPADMPLVRADAAQLERVFVNLLENALRFSPPGSAVRVRGGVGGGRVTVRVLDHGPGVPPGDRRDVFEPFFRGSGARRGGNGLGLAISRGFVEANGGTIVLQSGTPGETAFAVSLPLAPRPAAVER